MSSQHQPYQRQTRLARRSRASRARNVGAMAHYLNRRPVDWVEPQTVGMIQRYVGNELTVEDIQAIETDFERLELFLYNLNAILDSIERVHELESAVVALQVQYNLHGTLTDEEQTDILRLAGRLNSMVMYFPNLLLRYGRRPVPTDLRNIGRTLEIIFSIVHDLVEIDRQSRSDRGQSHSDRGQDVQNWIVDIRECIERGEILPEFVPEIREENRALERELVGMLNRLRL